MSEYQSGFGNTFSTEASAGVLPVGQNSPQKIKGGLYAEQLSGSAFTAPRTENLRSWLYRILPSVVSSEFKPYTSHSIQSAPLSQFGPPNQLRWDPFPIPDDPTDFLAGWKTLAVSGDVKTQTGNAIHYYSLNQGMENTFFYNSDGDLLFVPQEGTLELRTEMGNLRVEPCEIACIPRGIRFQVLSPKARGYLCENYGAHFQLPNLGPIGSNGLANPQDFLTPHASYEEKRGKFTLVNKFHGGLWQAQLDHSPLDVVAWRGNYAPFKYDLRLFTTIGTISKDHPDPSIFTVLTSPSTRPGTANVDFVIFPPRWMVADDTFRPPYYHRNVMSEYMGLIHGVYDAKTAGGFVPGGGSLHNCMSAHGPDASAYDTAIRAKLEPRKEKSLAFMFEGSQIYHPTPWALECPELQKNYAQCWAALKPGRA